MIQPKWSPNLQKWHISVYSGSKRIKTFWSCKQGKQGREEVLRKYEAYMGGNDDNITVYVSGRLAVRHKKEGMRKIRKTHTL